MAIRDEKIKDEIVEKFKSGNFKLLDLGKEYNTYASDISRILKSRNIRAWDTRHNLIRKYTLNDSYFDIIDCEQKAYFLGLLYADGSNNIKKTNISIRLQEQDKPILEKFVAAIGSNRPLLYTNYSSPGINRQPQYNVIFNSKKLSERLNDIGMVQNKEFVLTFPNSTILPTSLYRHFIRGYFDGDGSFSVYNITKNGKPQLRYEASIISTEMFCLTVQNIITNTLKITSHISIRHKNRENTTRTLKISGKQMFKFLEWMYNDSTIFLDRKHDKYINERSKLSEWPLLKKVNQYY